MTGALRLEARGVSWALQGRPILAPTDLTLGPGERVAVTGPSGSGKSTLLAILAGLLQPDQGTVLIDGEPLVGTATPAHGVATVLQGYGLVSLLTAAENIEVALRASGRSRRDAIAEGRDALDRLGLAAQADQLCGDLSGGQQQRTAIARAVALRPRLLIADEPTAELDPVARATVLAVLGAVTDRGGSLLLATHDPDIAASSDRTVALHAPGQDR